MLLAVLDIADFTIDVTTPAFQQDMEQDLAGLYRRAVAAENILHASGFMAYRRRRRYASDGDVAIQGRTQLPSADLQDFIADV